MTAAATLWGLDDHGPPNGHVADCSAWCLSAGGREYPPRPGSFTEEPARAGTKLYAGGWSIGPSRRALLRGRREGKAALR
ncbi:MAG: hypothetical protein QOI10_4452 [Solirubrobacterales bacterium]|nr:hypothetical protein [Solirubrobacterales bacterium]